MLNDGLSLTHELGLRASKRPSPPVLTRDNEALSSTLRANLRLTLSAPGTSAAQRRILYQSVLTE